MTSKVQKLERASLKDPVKIEINTKYKTVDALVQNYIFIPAKHKETYLVYLLTLFVGQKTIIFTTERYRLGEDKFPTSPMFFLHAIDMGPP